VLSSLILICVSEASAILVAIGLSVAWRTPWAIWWPVPLFLRLMHALFTLDRQGVPPPKTPSGDEMGTSHAYKIHCPQSNRKFILCSGPRSVVDQFFVHYGHPERNRLRELVQLSIAVSFGAVFPIGLFCTVIWMPPGVSYSWLSYQLYTVCQMSRVE
jgi:hypothetical protein